MRNQVAICHVIASVLSSDGEIHDEERKFLDEAMEDLNLSDEEKWDVLAFKCTADQFRNNQCHVQERRLLCIKANVPVHVTVETCAQSQCHKY